MDKFHLRNEKNRIFFIWEKKIMMLKEILNSYVKRDITESGINEPEKFYHLMLLL